MLQISPGESEQSRDDLGKKKELCTVLPETDGEGGINSLSPRHRGRGYPEKHPARVRVWGRGRASGGRPH